MSDVFIYSAIGTPLDAQEHLDVTGLSAQLEDHAQARIDGLLVAGTMGCMPLLTASVYADLAAKSVKQWRGRGELLMGVGDLSFARTVERIRLCNELQVDGVVALTPFFLPFSQQELIEYFQELAALSRKPLYLYDLPQRTGVALANETVEQLAQHPNIAGIKCSGDINQTRRLIDSLAGSKFRVVVAQAPMMDILIRAGVRDYVDGVYCIVPQLVRKITDASVRKDFEAAGKLMQVLNGLLDMLRKYGVFPATTVLMNERGIPGNFAPKPHATLSPERRQQLLAEPCARTALAASS